MKSSPPPNVPMTNCYQITIYIYIYIYKTKIKKTNLPPTIAACNQNISENSTQTPQCTYPPQKKKKKMNTNFFNYIPSPYCLVVCP